MIVNNKLSKKKGNAKYLSKNTAKLRSKGKLQISDENLSRLNKITGTDYRIKTYENNRDAKKRNIKRKLRIK